MLRVNDADTINLNVNKSNRSGTENMLKKLIAAGITTSVVIAGILTATPASAAVDITLKDQGGKVTTRVIAKDVVTGTTVNRPMTFIVDVPAPIFKYGNLKEHHVNITAKYSGKTCFLAGKTIHQGNKGDIALKTGYLAFDPTPKVWGKPGSCRVDVTVSSESSSYTPQGEEWKSIATGTGNFTIRAKNSVSKPKASATKVKKNKTVTLSGKATYKYGERFSSKLKSANVAKKTPLVLQQKVKGSSKWKNVKTVKVGSKGKWSTKVKVKKTTQYRVVLKKTNKYVGKTSSAVKVTIKK